MDVSSIVTLLYIQYLPNPPIFLINGVPKLRKGIYFPANHTQIYNYQFTDGEMVTFSCFLNHTKEFKAHYSLALYSETEETINNNGFVWHAFTLTKDHKVIRCAAWPNENTRHPKLLNVLIYLHYIPALGDSGAGHGGVTTKSLRADKTLQLPVPWIIFPATATVVILLLLVLVKYILRYRSTGKQLDDAQHVLRLAMERQNEIACIAMRQPMPPPPELVYDCVYHHGAGLLRPVRKGEQRDQLVTCD